MYLCKDTQKRLVMKSSPTFLNTFVQNILFILLSIVIIETECQLYQLPDAVLHMHVNGLLVDRCGGIIKPECFFLQRVEIIR